MRNKAIGGKAGVQALLSAHYQTNKMTKSFYLVFFWSQDSRPIKYKVGKNNSIRIELELKLLPNCYQTTSVKRNAVLSKRLCESSKYKWDLGKPFFDIWNGFGQSPNPHPGPGYCWKWEWPGLTWSGLRESESAKALLTLSPTCFNYSVQFHISSNHKVMIKDCFVTSSMYKFSNKV